MTSHPEPPDFDADQLLRAVRSWSSDRALEDAQRNRTSARWQQQLANQEMLFQGAILDAFERGVHVEVGVEGERSIHGAITTVGKDFVAITPDARPTVFVGLSALQTITLAGTPRSVGPASARQISDAEPTLLDILGELVEDRPRLRVRLIGAVTFENGELYAVGQDVISLSTDYSNDGTSFIHAPQIAELVLA